MVRGMNVRVLPHAAAVALAGCASAPHSEHFTLSTTETMEAYLMGCAYPGATNSAGAALHEMVVCATPQGISTAECLRRSGTLTRCHWAVKHSSVGSWKDEWGNLETFGGARMLIEDGRP